MDKEKDRKKVVDSNETRKKSSRKSRRKKGKRKHKEEEGSEDSSTSSSSISKSRSRRKKGGNYRRSSDVSKQDTPFSSLSPPFEESDNSSESTSSLSDNHTSDGLPTPELCTDSSTGDGNNSQTDSVAQLITFSYSSTDEEILPLKVHRTRNLPIKADEKHIQQLWTGSKLQEACNSSEELCSFLKSFSGFVKILFPRKNCAMVGIAPADSEEIFRVDAPGIKEQMSIVPAHSSEPRAKVSAKKKRRKNGRSRLDALSDSPFAIHQHYEHE